MKPGLCTARLEVPASGWRPEKLSEPSAMVSGIQKGKDRDPKKRKTGTQKKERHVQKREKTRQGSKKEKDDSKKGERQAPNKGKGRDPKKRKTRVQQRKHRGPKARREPGEGLPPIGPATASFGPAASKLRPE